MPIRLKEPDGTIWEFDTAEEAKSFRGQGVSRPSQARPERPAQIGVPHERTNGNGPSASNTIGDWSTTTITTIKMALAALAKAGDPGMTGQELADALKLKGPRGLAGGAQSVRSYLAQKLPPGVKPEMVFWRKLNHDGSATWHVNRKLITDHGIIA